MHMDTSTDRKQVQSLSSLDMLMSALGLVRIRKTEKGPGPVAAKKKEIEINIIAKNKNPITTRLFDFSKSNRHFRTELHDIVSVKINVIIVGTLYVYFQLKRKNNSK